MPRGQIVVVGGANVDIKVRPSRVLRLGTSNAGSTHISLGGVARNIAENLARLDVHVALMTAVGDDAFGRKIREHAEEACIDTTLIAVGGGSTGTYTALLDGRGRLVAAVSSMQVLDAITPEHVETGRAGLAQANAIVCDCNLSPASVLRIGQIATETDVDLFVEGVSVPKVANVRRLLASRCAVAGIFLNRDEIGALTGAQARGRRQLVGAAGRLHDSGVANVVVGLGERGAFVSGADGEHGVVASMAAEVVDVTGAGDAAVAATVWALGTGVPLTEAVRAGQAAAALTVATPETVSPTLTPAAIRRVLARMVS